MEPLPKQRQVFGTPSKPQRRVTPLHDHIATPEKPSEIRRRAGDASSGLGGPLERDAKIDGGEVIESLLWQSDAGSRGNLPEKCEKLMRLFNSLVTSVRLLQMRRKMCTFSNINPKIECLTHGRLTLGNLAQLKFILPEAILIKRILLHDEATCCMMPDLHIFLSPDALINNMKLRSESGYFILIKVFNARLVQYFMEHPEDDDVPEGILPEPFKQPTLTTKFPDVIEDWQPSITSSSGIDMISQEQFENPTCVPIENPTCSYEQTTEWPLHSDSSFAEKPSVTSATPSRVASTPVRLMISTPKLQNLKRSCSSVDGRKGSTEKKSVKRPLTLDYQVDSISSSVFVPEDHVDLVNESTIDDNRQQQVVVSKEEHRKQMIACLPKLLKTVLQVFQHANSSFITKQQLVFKIISSQLDVEDKGEVEEQLNLFLEIAPDWISEKTTSSGDVLVWINK